MVIKDQVCLPTQKKKGRNPVEAGTSTLI